MKEPYMEYIWEHQISKIPIHPSSPPHTTRKNTGPLASFGICWLASLAGKDLNF
jgi:hypothetical protein